MPRKSSGETHFWDNAKEKKFLKKLDEFLSYSGGASGFESVTMRDGSNPYVEAKVSMDNSGTQPVLNENLTPTNCGWQGVNRRAGDDVGPSRSRGNSGNRKQREATNELTYSAMQEIVSHFCSRSQSGTSNDQSNRPDHLLTCMNIMTEMGIPLNQWTVMWHYFEAHPRVQRTFHQLPDEDRRDIIASVVKSQSPSDD
ncbi:hypothetical protein TIFTF001_017118 [Ficus carica]|uniref:Uncharacterized protein n=1 Tax=Ficus carica TaxID=3494 RepID=A0AA88AA00_FICCA|nr:hypothetical protein TIFTF001_017118 [Ficus carica]